MTYLYPCGLRAECLAQKSCFESTFCQYVDVVTTCVVRMLGACGSGSSSLAPEE